MLKYCIDSSFHYIATCTCVLYKIVSLFSCELFLRVKFKQGRVFLLQVTKEELAKLVQGFEKQDILTSSGVTLAGSRYIYLSGTDRVIRAKLGKVGVHCMKTTQGKKQTNR